jgi:hypothetical protein
MGKQKKNSAKKSAQIQKVSINNSNENEFVDGNDAFCDVLGRPTKYVEGVTDLAVLGAFWDNEYLTMPELAKVLRVNKDTIYEWAKVHPSFSDALQKARKGLRNVIIGSAIKESIAYYYTEEVLNKDGSIIELKKHARPSGPMLKLMLSNFGIRESTVVENKTSVAELDLTKLSEGEQETLHALLSKAR